jgi:hypothetical protein
MVPCDTVSSRALIAARVNYFNRFICRNSLSVIYQYFRNKESFRNFHFVRFSLMDIVILSQSLRVHKGNPKKYKNYGRTEHFFIYVLKFCEPG